jgi:hypothetical protein
MFGNIFASHDNCGSKYPPLCVCFYTSQHFELAHPCVAEFACFVAAVAAEVLTSRLQRSKGAGKERVELMVDTYLSALSTCLLQLSVHPPCDVSAFLFCVWPLHHMATLRTSTTRRKSSLTCLITTPRYGITSMLYRRARGSPRLARAA